MEIVNTIPSSTEENAYVEGKHENLRLITDGIYKIKILINEIIADIQKTTNIDKEDKESSIIDLI